MNRRRFFVMLSLFLFPLAFYFFLLAWFNGRGTPTVVSGISDLMLLAWGLVGVFLYGPGKLLIPLNVLTFWGGTAWIFWAAFYVIACFLVVLKFRRRIVVYNCPQALLETKLLEMAKTLDPAAQSLGNSISLPNLRVQFFVETTPLFRNAVLSATGPLGPLQREDGWNRFQNEIGKTCRSLSVPFNPVAVLFFAAAVILGVSGTILLLYDYVDVVEAVHDSLP